jgi:hypothetical protein
MAQMVVTTRVNGVYEELGITFQFVLTILTLCIMIGD